MALPVPSVAPLGVALLVVVGIVYGVYTIFESGRRSAKMPPGPPTALLFGNELQMPTSRAHLHFTKWAKQYGGIYSLKRFKNTTIVLTDRKLIKDFIDRKSNLYSHRPQSIVSHTITNLDHLLVMPYSDRWRSLRKTIHQHFMESKCDREHWILQEAEATQMIFDYWQKPADHMMHPRRFSNSITNSLVYGIRSKTVNDPYVQRLYALMEKWSIIQELGATPPVDDFLILRYLPQFMVSNWRGRAQEVGRMMKSLYKDVLDDVIARREKGIIRDSLMDKVLDVQEKNALSDNELHFLGGVLMEGGSDTSSALISTIVQALSKFPEVQAKAHAEIDAVIGEDQSPRWEDFSKLPYVNMIIKEGHRWRPVVPMGVPHSVGQDDYMDGMLVPKGSTIVINAWGMHHDPETWAEPEKFNPERYAAYPSLASTYAASGEWDGRDHYGYGAGRRICPGIHLAERNLAIGVSKLLWAFEFSHPTGTVSDINPESGLSEGFLQAPKDYGLGIKLRSAARGETIRRDYEKAQEIFARYD